MLVTVCTESEKKLLWDDPGKEDMGSYVAVKVCTEDIGDDDPYGLVLVQCSTQCDKNLIEASEKLKNGEIPFLTLEEASKLHASSSSKHNKKNEFFWVLNLHLRKMCNFKLGDELSISNSEEAYVTGLRETINTEKLITGTRLYYSRQPNSSEEQARKRTKKKKKEH